MASEQNDAVFDLDDESSQSHDDDEDEEEEEEDDGDLNSVSPSHSFPSAVPIAVHSVTVAASNDCDLPPITVAEVTASDLKRQRVGGETTVIVHSEGKKPLPQPQPLDESRRGLFQRLWTDEDEIELLQGFLDYSTQRGGNHHDTALFYDQIKSKLQLDFNKNQLVEKLRRLKKKYRNVIDKISSGKGFSFKSPHDQATFEISRKIWTAATPKIEDGNLEDEEGNPNPNPYYNFFVDGEVKIEDHKSTPRSRKRPRSRLSAASTGSGVKVDDNGAIKDAAFLPNNNINNINSVSNANLNVSGLIEETVRSSLLPLFKELLSNAMAGGSCSGGRGIGGLVANAMPLSFSGGGEMMMADEKWRKQQILELEVYAKRLELVQEQIKTQLEELRSMGG